MDYFTTFITSFISPAHPESKLSLDFVDGNSGLAHPVLFQSEADLEIPTDSDDGGNGNSLCVIA
jgi:hypothetical protein